MLVLLCSSESAARTQLRRCPKCFRGPKPADPVSTDELAGGDGGHRPSDGTRSDDPAVGHRYRPVALVAHSGLAYCGDKPATRRL
jgi:hypothetical protein